VVAATSSSAAAATATIPGELGGLGGATGAASVSSLPLERQRVRQTMMMRPRGRDALAVSQGAELGGLGGATGASASSPLLGPRQRKTLPKPKYLPQQPVVVTVEAEVEKVQAPLLVVGISESDAAASASAFRSAAYAAHQAPLLAGGGCSQPKQHVLPLPVPLSSPKLKSWPHNVPPPPPPPLPWEAGPHRMAPPLPPAPPLRVAGSGTVMRWRV
jgi:hypothetical protein